MTERQVQLINDFKPDIITVTPSYMLAILNEFKRQGLDPRQSSLRFGIFGAEPWTNAMRAEIEGAFGLDATDIYGLSEVIGPGVAQECVESKMTVRAEARPEHWDGSGLMDHAEKVTAHIKNTIGITTQIRIVAPETLERSLGKAKRVVDKRPKG